jgi:hypothetical protein
MLPLVLAKEMTMKKDRQVPDPQSDQKKAYDVPSLTEYGDFTRLTQGGGGITNDGAAVFTKA